MPKVDVEKLRKLAVLELTPDEKKEVEQKVKEVLGYFEKLRSLDLSGIDPMYTVEFEKPHYRDDEPLRFDSDELLRLVHKGKDRYVKAPRMV